MFRSLKTSFTLALILFVQQNCFAQNNGINLAFNNADVEAVIATVARATNRSIVVDPKVRGKISLNSSQALTADQAIDSLSTALRMNGFALVNTASGYRVVTEADAKLQSSQTYTSTTGVTGDQIITRVFQLNFESAANVVAIIRPLVSPNNTINALPGNNSILVTDYASNIGRIEKIDRENQELTVLFDGKHVIYSFLDLDSLVLAYATSVHKYQGSECPCVVIPVHTSHFAMLHRNLLYTAVTRGKRLVVLVGSGKAIGIAVNNDDVKKRHTGLQDLLQQENSYQMY